MLISTTPRSYGYYNTYKEHDGGHVGWVTEREPGGTFAGVIGLTMGANNVVPLAEWLAEHGICLPEDRITWQRTATGWDGYTDGRRVMYIND